MKINPWEIPTDKFAERIEEGATIACKGNDWQVLLIRTVTPHRKILAVRQLNCEMPLLWWVGRPTSVFSIDSICVWSAKEGKASPEELVLEALKEERLALRYYTNSDLDLRSEGGTATRRFSLNAHRQGAWQKIGGDINVTLTSRVLFSWPTPVEEILTRNSLGWWKMLREELTDPQSDASFALGLSEMSSRQQHDALWKWKNGSYETAREVLWCAFLSQHELWDKESWWRWDINFPLGDEKRYGTINSRMGLREPNSLPALQGAAELINHYLSPHPDEHLVDASFCARSWYERHPIKFGIYHEAPTMHERMEAALLWREWQKKMGG